MRKTIILLTTALLIITIIYTLFQVIRVQDIILRRIFPKEYSEYVERYAAEFDIDPLLIYSIIKAESNFDQRARSRVGAIGLMQVMEPTAIEVAQGLGIDIYDTSKLYQPSINIRIGVAYFRTLKDLYDGNKNLAIIAYNGGRGNVSAWIAEGVIQPDGSDPENVPFPETNMYIRRILRNYEIYRRIY